MIQLVAGLALLYFGREVFIPLAMAFVLATVLRPLVRRMESWRIPSALGAAVVIVSLLGALWGIGFALTPAVQGFADQLPTEIRSASQRLRTLPRPLDRLGGLLATGSASVGIHAAAAGGSPGDSTHRSDSVGRSDSTPAPRRHPGSTGSAGPDSASSGSSSSGITSALPMIGKAFGSATGVLSGALEILLLLAFFLAAGGDVRARLVAHSRGSPLAKGIVAVGDEVESVISQYLSLLGLINLVQGTVVAVLMALIGMPAPVVWGALTVVAEFFPYLGGATMVVLLTLVGLASSNGPGSVLLAPAIYLAVTTTQNSLISPITYGRRLKLNPAAILFSVMTWWLLWGVIGAFLAVPILATIRIIAERVKGPLAAVAALIEG